MYIQISIPIKLHIIKGLNVFTTFNNLCQEVLFWGELVCLSVSMISPKVMNGSLYFFLIWMGPGKRKE